jgi:hypothetical protein
VEVWCARTPCTQSLGGGYINIIYVFRIYICIYIDLYTWFRLKPGFIDNMFVRSDNKETIVDNKVFGACLNYFK